MRIVLRTLHIHQTACAFELVGGNVALPEHVQLSVSGHGMRIGEHVHLDGVRHELLGDVRGHQSLVESSFGEVHPVVVGAPVTHDKSPVKIPLDGFRARGEVEHEFVEAGNVILCFQFALRQ